MYNSFLKSKRFNSTLLSLFSLVVLFCALGSSVPASALGATQPDTGAGSNAGSVISTNTATNKGSNYCGDKNNDKVRVQTSIDIGCRGKGNPILDMMFAILRLLSDGVGLIIVLSIIIGGIQYTMSAGDPQSTAKAIGRIRATLFALLLYIFAYPLLNYLLPAGFF